MNPLNIQLTLKRIIAANFKIRRIKPWDQFHSNFYLDHTFRRLEHLSSLHLDIQGKSVLEFGAGVGDLTGYFISRGCQVTSTDSRQDLVHVLSERYPTVKSQIFDLESNSTNELDINQIVFAYGILYHISNPKRAIALMSNLAAEMLILETVVSNDGDISNTTAENSGSYSQASSGYGSRPNRLELFLELKKHFEFVYLPISQPRHPEFPLDWNTNPLPDLSRAIFICSRNEIKNQNLSSDFLERHDRQI